MHAHSRVSARAHMGRRRFVGMSQAAKKKEEEEAAKKKQLEEEAVKKKEQKVRPRLSADLS